METQESAQDEAGNVLMSSWADSDLIFRYRCIDDKKRQMIRGDRTLAIRLSEYTGVDPIPIADETNDVLEAMRRGRCRYLVTSTSSISTRDNRPGDMKLAYRAANEHPDKFTLIEDPFISLTVREVPFNVIEPFGAIKLVR